MSGRPVFERRPEPNQGLSVLVKGSQSLLRDGCKVIRWFAVPRMDVVFHILVGVVREWNSDLGVDKAKQVALVGCSWICAPGCCDLLLLSDMSPVVWPEVIVAVIHREVRRLVIQVASCVMVVGLQSLSCAGITAAAQVPAAEQRAMRPTSGTSHRWLATGRTALARGACGK